MKETGPEPRFKKRQTEPDILIVGGRHPDLMLPSAVAEMAKVVMCDAIKN